MLATIVALFISMLALPQTAQAQAERYDLWIADTRVTSDNCNDLSVIDGVSGTAKYDPATKTLTLENASISTTYTDIGIRGEIDGLTIRVKGTVNVTTQAVAFSLSKPYTITGGGTLNVTSSGNSGIYANQTDLTIDGCTVNAKGLWGISGNDGNTETLTLRNATVTAEGNLGSICSFKTIRFDGCAITSPEDAAFDPSLKGVAIGGQLVEEKVTIELATTPYGLRIAGVSVTSVNYTDLSTIPGVTGTVTYAPTTKTLTLDNATIDGGQDDAILSNIDGLTVKLIGTNTVTTAETSAILHYRPMTITGGGTLNVETSRLSGISAVECSLTIEGCTVNAKGSWGIKGGGLSDLSNLIIRNATVTAEGSLLGSITDFKTFTLDGCKITSPAGAKWNPTKKAVTDVSGNIIKEKVTITAAVSYDLEIAGKRVHELNCNDLSVIPGVTGTVKYDPTTKTLTLDNATINGGNNKGIYSRIDGLTMKLTRTNMVTSETAAIWHDRSTTITGRGTLNAESGSDCGIYTPSTDLTIEGCTVNAKGKWGITGQFGMTETLTVRNATVTAEGTSGSIRDFKTLILIGCDITSPARAKWNPTKKAVCDAFGNVVKTKVSIVPVTFYDLWMASTQVHSANCNDLTVISGVSGTVTYDPATKTLTLNNATIAATGNDGGIYSGIDGLTLRVKGSVNVTTQAVALVFSKPTTITGGGTLNITGGESCCFIGGTHLTIDGCTVNAKGKQGIAGLNTSVETLTVRNATLTVESDGTNSSICGLKDLILDGCVITQPAGAAFDPSLKGVALNGQLVKTKVTIQPVTPYDLVIAGEQVHSANCADLTAIPGVTGTASYDPDTKTLTLDDATIAATGNNRGISGRIDGLTLRVKGTVNITAPSNSGIMFLKPGTITGDGTLNTTSGGECGIYVNETDLTIDGCTVHAKGRWGIAGLDGKVESLTVKNATVTAESDGADGSLIAFLTLTLDGCAITQPTGAVWNATKKAVCDASGNVITAKVTITCSATDIEAVTTDVPAKKRGVYNLQGVYLGDSLDHLPAGVYIYNGKKIIKK